MKAGASNGTPAAPVASPPNLLGDRITATSPDRWLFLIARHGRGVACVMLDGSGPSIQGSFSPRQT